MRHTDLQGWSVSVSPTTIQEQGPDGQPRDAEGWILVFTEKLPPTGDTVRFAFGRQVRDSVVRQLTGGIVLHGGDLPRSI